MFCIIHRYIDISIDSMLAGLSRMLGSLSIESTFNTAQLDFTLSSKTDDSTDTLVHPYTLIPVHSYKSKQRLDEMRAAHEETLESERQVHRDRMAEREGIIARLEHDIRETSMEGER